VPGEEVAVKALDHWWRPLAPATRIGFLRVLVGTFVLAYLAARIGHLIGYAGFDPGHFRPVGVVAVLDRPLLPWVVRGLGIATLVMAVPFLLGWRFHVTGPVFAALLLWTITYRNSWGMIWHTENLMVIQVIILALAPSADAWSLDARRRGAPAEPDRRYGWPLRLMCAVVVIAYVIAGLAKLRNAGGGWMFGDELRNYVATDNLRKILLGDWYSPLAAPLLHVEWLFQFLAFATVALEVGAPVALLGRRWALGWVIAAMSFHWGVLALMMIGFPYQMCGVGFACFFRVERLGEWLRRRLGRSSPAPQSA
jgi:hypothetical protein